MLDSKDLLDEFMRGILAYPDIETLMNGEGEKKVERYGEKERKREGKREGKQGSEGRGSEGREEVHAR